VTPASTTLGEVCRLANGNAFSSKDWTDHGLPIIRIANLNGSKDFDFFAGEPDSKWTVEPGDLLFSWSGTRGTSFGPARWDGPRAVLNQHIFKVTPRSGIDSQWLFAILEALTTRIEKKAHGGSGIVHVRKADLVREPISVPSIEEQTKLGDLVELVRSISQRVGKLIDAKRTFKRGLMQQLLTGQERFPEFRAGPWELYRFDRLCEEVSDRNGGRFGSDSVMGVFKGAGFEPMRERVRGKGDLSRYKVVPPEAFAYNPMRLNIGSIAFNDVGRPIVVSPDYEVFRVRSGEVDPHFVNQLRHSSYWTSFMKRAGTGSVRVRIYFTDLARLRVPKPALEEQERIATALRLADSELDLIAAQRDQIEMLKRSLLSRLVSGSLQVPS